MLAVLPTAWADVSVPLKLQAQLIARIASFDRNFGPRSGGNALVLLIEKPGDAHSTHVVHALATALRELTDIGGLPKTIQIVDYQDAAALAQTVIRAKPAILYFSVGLEGEMKAIARALNGLDLLTIGATGVFADGGANVGFDLEGSRPKLVINLETAKAQNVDLKAQLVKLAHVVGQ